MSAAQEYVIDGEALNKLLESYNLEAHQPTMEMHRLLASQVFEIMEKKLNKGILDEIDKAKPQSVRFVNLEAITSGPHKDYLEPIAGGLTVLIGALKAKDIQCTGTIQNPLALPWHLVAKLDKTFKGLPAPGQTSPP
ncbi:MAG TPA: hypothetical protein VLV18_00930 [Terriglobales bacterium]|nr:hypothetical protein [Terriglobales bacterium]